MLTENDRNSICVCGSQKLAKNCCLENILSFPRPQLLDPPPSANAHWTDSEIPDDTLWGLSTQDMQEVFALPFNLKNHLFSVNQCEPGDYLMTPIVQQALFFLRRLEEEKFFKATQRGNLPRKFVHEFYESQLTHYPECFKPHREDDCLPLTRLKFLLLSTHMVNLSKGKFEVTDKGLLMLDPENHAQLFNELFFHFSDEWNWAYGDRLPDLPSVQFTLPFQLFLLHKAAQNWVAKEELGSYMFNAFPEIVEEVDYHWGDPSDTVIRAFTLRLIRRFCEPLGFVESKDADGLLNEQAKYRVTPFFNRYFTFIPR